MKELIIRKIKFKTCYHFLLLNVAIIVASLVLYPLKMTALRVAISGLTFFLTLYAELGYIKYSFIQNERRFRRIIIAAIGLSAIQSLLSLLNVLIKFDQTKHTVYLGIIMLLSTPLFYFAFGLIRNEDMKFFGKLSRLNLYLPIISLLGALLYVLKVSHFLLFLPIILAGLVVAILLWYWQIKLFRHLSLKYNET